MKNIVRFYFKWLSFISAKIAGKQSIELFQRTFHPKRRFRKRELRFYNEAGHFKTTGLDEDIHCYEMGDPAHEMVLLVHGWNSNAGSMHAIASTLVSRGFYVLAFDLPAHGYSSLKKANMVSCAEALRSVIQRMLPDKPFSVISHSFGSAVVSYALSGTRFKLNRWVMLTAPNQIEDVFLEFKNMIGLNLKAYNYMAGHAEAILKEGLKDVSVQEKLKKVSCQQLLILHDSLDRMLPYQNSVDIHNSIENSNLITLENIGHYRMLSNKKVLDEIKLFISPVKEGCSAIV